MLVKSATNLTNTLIMYIQHITNILFIFFKTLGVRAENNPVMSSISDQCYFYAKYDKNASTLACFLKFLG